MFGTKRDAPSFVGRQVELALLEASMRQAHEGRGRIVMLSGEPGIGKTRLAERFGESFQQAGACVLWGRCTEGEGSALYGPWADALRGYASAATAERLGAVVGANASLLCRLVPALHALLPESSGTAMTLGAEEERFRLHDAVVQLLLAIAGDGPVLIVLDDLHWADPDSLLLLRRVGRFVNDSRLVVLGTYRDVEIDRHHPLAETLAMLRREVDYERISLGAWSIDETAAYLDQADGAASSHGFPSAIVRRIHDQTQGSPFYTREFLRHLTEEGLLVQRDGRWWTDHNLREIGIPEGIRQVIGRRLARLSESTNAVLHCAAGCSGGFAFRLLQGLTGLPEARLLDCIDEALAAGLIRVLSEEGEIYDFNHALVRHTLYAELSPSRRARLHRRIAELLEVIGPTLADFRDAEVAAQYHASRSLPGADRGIPYAVRAAERARGANAPQQTVALLRIARDLVEAADGERRIDVLQRLAVAEAEGLQLADVQRTVDVVLEALATAAAPSLQVVQFLEQVARALKEGGAPHSVWQPLVARGLALLADRRDLWWARLALLQDQYVEVSRGTVNAYRWVGNDPLASQLARTLGDEDDHARSLDPLSWREPDETLAALVHVRAWSRPTAILRGLNVVARDQLYRQGDFVAAVERYHELFRAAERYGSVPYQAESQVQLTVALVALGQFGQAREALARARERVARLGPEHRLHFVVNVGAPLGLAHYTCGDWSSVAEHAQLQVSASRSARTPLGIMASACLALAQWRTGNAAEARHIIGSLAHVVEQLEPRLYMHNYVVSIAGLVVWEMRARELAPLFARLAADLIEAHVGPSCIGNHELTAARMAALMVDQPQAEHWFRLARVVADQHGMRADRPIINFDEGRFLIGLGSRGRGQGESLLRQAAREFRISEMPGWAERAEVLVSGRTAVELSDGLTAREIEVLQLIASGRTSKDIATELVLSVATVQRHVANIYAKIGARGRADAAAYALRRGLLPIQSHSPT